MTIHAHIFTNIPEIRFLKQIPDFQHTMDGVKLSFGLDVPDDADVLIVYTRASYSIPTKLPKNRTAFYAGEPDVIHPFSTGFLNQFGIVLTTSAKELDTIKLRQTVSAMAFVGLDFDDIDNPLNVTYFADLKCPQKNDKISIVTSNKAHTEYHQKRLEFLDVVKEKIPDHIELFGQGFKSVADKKDALIDYKYHIALENGTGKYAWTEKLSDPLMCWTFPFYHGCDNVEDDLPDGSFQYIDISNPDAAINQMMAGVKDDIWTKQLDSITEARHIIFTEFNLCGQFAKLAKQLMSLDTGSSKQPPKRLIRSERSLWPESGARGSVPEYLIRSALLFINPNIELKAAHLQQKMKERRHAKRAAKLASSDAKH